MPVVMSIPYDTFDRANFTTSFYGTPYVCFSSIAQSPRVSDADRKLGQTMAKHNSQSMLDPTDAPELTSGVLLTFWFGNWHIAYSGPGSRNVLVLTNFG